MSARITNAQVLAAFEALTKRLDALEAAPVPAPAVGKPRSTFIADMAARQAAKIPCEIHASEVCNRRFNEANESGRAKHNPEFSAKRAQFA